MSCLRPAALLAALALLLTACAPAARSEPIGSSPGEEPPADASGTLALDVQQLAVQILQPLPDRRPVLTQADIDCSLAQVMERYSAAAVAVATVEAGQISQSGAWGWAVKGEREMTPDTKLRVASLSKVVVAMCAMAMAEEGIVDLDAPSATTGALTSATRTAKASPPSAP